MTEEQSSAPDFLRTSDGTTHLVPLLVTIKQTGSLLARGRTSIYQLLASHKLEAVKIGKSRRVVLSSVHRYLAELRQQDKAAPRPRPRR